MKSIGLVREGSRRLQQPVIFQPNVGMVRHSCFCVQNTAVCISVCIRIYRKVFVPDANLPWKMTKQKCLQSKSNSFESSLMEQCKCKCKLYSL